MVQLVLPLEQRGEGKPRLRTRGAGALMVTRQVVLPPPGYWGIGLRELTAQHSTREHSTTQHSTAQKHTGKQSAHVCSGPVATFVDRCPTIRIGV